MSNTRSSGGRVGHPDFMSLFQRRPQAVADAYDPFTLLGDHLETNGGYRLSMLPSHGTHVETAMRNDVLVRVWRGERQGEGVRYEYSLDDPSPVPGGTDIVRAVTDLLRHEGYSHRGFDVRVLTPHAGGASRVSLTVGLLLAMRQALALDLSVHAVAELAYRTDADSLREPVGLGSYRCCASGSPGSAFLVDAATQEIESVTLPSAVDWVIMPSTTGHDRVMELNLQRRRECEAACALLGLRWLRDLQGAGRQEVLASLEALPSPLGERARHVVMENERVLTSLALLESGNIDRFGLVMDASQESLRSDFELSSPWTDALIDLSLEEPSVYGARLAFDAMGTAVIMAVEAGTGRGVAAHLAERCGQPDASDVLPAAVTPAAA